MANMIYPAGAGTGHYTDDKYESMKTHTTKKQY